ncbi:MAG TPA: hypothetical protein VGF14_06355 [Alphaproteobacteria bacterium]
MVKPPATNMTITLQQSGGSQASVKPLVVGEQIVVHTNAASSPILPHQPVAPEQDHHANPLETLLEQAGFALRPSEGNERLRDFTNEQLELLSNRYTIRR